jgi:hypothetical protein
MKLREFIPKPLKKWLKKSRNLVIDPYTYYKSEPIVTLAARTLRYRCAGLRIALTENERRLLAFRDKHKGQRAFILGNGPSLNKCNLTLLANEITFGVNSIFLNYERMGFKPTYYFVEDVFVAEDRAEQINAHQGSIKFFGNYLRYCLHENTDTIWLNVCIQYDEYPDFPNFSYNAARLLWVGGTVTYLCLQMAYYMGFTAVYMIGFDHSYQIPTSLIEFGKKGRDFLSTEDDPNHFHPDYFGKGYRWHNPRVDRMETAFQKSRLAFEANGRTIINATIGGKLEVFERVAYEDLFREPK